MTQTKVETTKVGTWLYDETIPMPVLILAQNWDFYHEDAYDAEPPDLNAEGRAFYVVYGEPSASGYRSRTCLSLAEAVALAEETVGPIAWQT